MASYFGQRMSRSGLLMICEGLKIHGVNPDDNGIVAYDGMGRRFIVLDRRGQPSERPTDATKIRPNGARHLRDGGRR